MLSTIIFTYKCRCCGVYYGNDAYEYFFTKRKAICKECNNCDGLCSISYLQKCPHGEIWLCEECFPHLKQKRKYNKKKT